MTPGRQYLTTCIRAAINSITPPDWLPVIGQPHDDAKYIGFKPVHVHLDWRFLDAEQRESIRSMGENAVHDAVIVVTYPEGTGMELKLKDALADDSIPNHSFIRTLFKTYQGPFPAYPSRQPYWMPALSKAYRDSRMGNDHICPHRGADLSGVDPDEHGVITCPLHGLRWCAKTGEPAPPAETEPKAGATSPNRPGVRH